MKTSSVIATAALAGFAVVVMLGISGTRAPKVDRFDDCHRPGIVNDDCAGLYPSLPFCQVEDCSDVGQPGYWIDPTAGHLVYVVADQRFQDAPQRPEVTS